MYMKALIQILTALVVILFYIVWVPCALFKDLIQLFYVPCDMQRMVNTFIATVRNLQALSEVWVPTKTEQTQPPARKQVIGFAQND
jgi:hypothetical protein